MRARASIPLGESRVPARRAAHRWGVAWVCFVAFLCAVQGWATNNATPAVSRMAGAGGLERTLAAARGPQALARGPLKLPHAAT